MCVVFILKQFPGDLFFNPQVTKGKSERSFYSLPEFEEWKNGTENWHTYKVKYYKGIFFFAIVNF